jgi:cysteinyl-tRNA synthetase
MALTIYNTLSHSLEPVEPSGEESLGFYCCGPTVYAAAHIGNFRTFVIQDVFRRVAELSGIPVNHVRNLTNVDDKTIRTANAEGKSLQEVTDFWTAKFHADADALNLLRPSVEPGAVEHIAEQIELIQTLMDKGVAYQGGDGSVYFRIEAFPEYGRLSGVADRELTTDTAALDSDEYDRDSLADFALWKAVKPEDGEIAWDSPWGRGRPGWHLECSAMSMKYLGPSFDVHSGGIDLCFPHHENEIAQSEAATGQPFSRLWFHVVHLMVNGKKMSKSLGNLYTLDDLAEKGFSPAEVRYALVSGHYRKHLNFTFESVQAARGNLERLTRLMSKLQEVLGVDPPTYPELCDQPFTKENAGRFAPAFEALQENLNVPKALGEVFRAAAALEKHPESATVADLQGLCRVVEGIGLQLPELQAGKAPAEVIALAEQRAEARVQKDFAASDRLRDEIASLGWTVRDVAGGYELDPVS